MAPLQSGQRTGWMVSRLVSWVGVMRGCVTGHLRLRGTAQRSTPRIYPEDHSQQLWL